MKDSIIRSPLARRLVIARKRTGLSQKKAALALGVSDSAVAQWETSQTKPTIDNIEAAAKLYAVGSDWLLSESEPTQSELENLMIEAAILRAVRDLPDEQKRTALRIVKSLKAA